MSYERASSRARRAGRAEAGTHAARVPRCADRRTTHESHDATDRAPTAHRGRPGREMADAIGRKSPLPPLSQSHPQPHTHKCYLTPSPNRPSAVYSHRYVYRVLTHSSITHVVFAVPAAGPRRRSPRQQMTALERCKLISNEARLAPPSRRCRCLSACVSEPQLHRADIEARS